ncbi:MAG: efflux RND transporter periplasmic adaptor subunit [Thiomicrospira sp.]|jgi:RND family efflux transporter MFP subunit|nr:efflux RND transporter periplasmic adaptor subunit [Thiomicrospira sp.]
MHKRHLHPPIYIAIVLSLSLLSGCQQETTEQAEPVPFVNTTEIEPADDQAWYLHGTLDNQRYSALAFQIGGQVAQRFVNTGAEVMAGERLLQLDATDLTLKLESLRANLAAQEAELIQAQQEATRLNNLIKRNLTSQQTVDRALTQVKTLQQHIIATRREIELQQRFISYTDLYAPAEGLVQRVEVDQGQVVASGQPVISFLFTDGLDVLVDVPENRIDQLPRVAELFIGSAQQSLGEVHLRELTPESDYQSRTWEARYALSQTQAAPINVIGQSARLRFSDQQAWYKIPLSALVERGEGAFVWMIKDQQVQPLAVQVRQLGQDVAYIEGDWPPGTRIVQSGVHLLQPGQTVRERGR